MIAMGLCLGCMEEFEDQFQVCPSCGYVRGTPPEEGTYLTPGSILQGKYMVGRVLGYGGFGVTYIGWDLFLNRKVVVKEYLPSDFSTRMPGENVVTVYTNEETNQQFIKGMKKFVEEAQSLAQFHSVPGIVDVYASFEENNTAYIVMEYLKGRNILQVLKQEGPFPYARAKEIILEILTGLEAVHRVGMIHRDISPDNIFMTDDGAVRLLDFGAARYATISHSKSLSIILKPGYAPPEQYKTHGEQGPRTDVYAAAATLYKMLTGVTPPDSLERGVKDTLRPPSALKVYLPESAENAIMNAMNLSVKRRTATAAEFAAQLMTDGVLRVEDETAPSPPGQFPKWLKVAFGCLGAVVILTGTLLLTGKISFSMGESGLVSAAPVMESGEINAPGVVNLSLTDAEQAVKDVGLELQIVDKQNSTKTPRDKVMSQTPTSGRLIMAGNTLDVVVSAGRETCILPDLLNMLEADAVHQLKTLGLESKVKTEASETVVKGAVISQSVPADAEAAKGDTVVLTVSSGSASGLEIKDVEIPSLLGLSLEDAVKKAAELHLYVVKKEEQYQSDVPKGIIYAQDPGGARTGKTGDTIKVFISLGPEQTRVPDVQYKGKDEAVSMLKKAKLKYQLVDTPSDTVQKDHIISQGTAYNSMVPVDTVIVLQVSSGKKGAASPTKSSASSAPASSAAASSQAPPPVQSSQAPVSSLPPVASVPQTVEVPNVSGMDREEATAVLKEKGFQVQIVYQDVDADQQGNVVLSQDIRGGQTAPPQSTVVLTISRITAPKLIMTMPDVTGILLEDAQEILTDMDLIVEIYTVYGEDEQIVMSQSIPANNEVEEGTTVTLSVSDPNIVDMSRMPDLMGLTKEDANFIIRKYGLKVKINYIMVDFEEDVDVVLDQSPSPGSSIQSGQRIDLYLGKLNESEE